jgi:hypothetical protein
MYKKPAFLLLDSLRSFECFVNIIRKDDFGAVCAAGRNTCPVGGGNHYNFCAGANRLSGESRSDRMIAGADGRHAQIALLSRQAAKHRQSTTRFESSGALQKLEFGVDPCIPAQTRFKTRATNDWRTQNGKPLRFPKVFYRFKRWPICHELDLIK